MPATAIPAPAAPAPTGLFVGLATVDVIQLVDTPPGPDDKITGLDQVVAAGGPATNAAVAFAALGGRALLAAPVGVGPLAGLVRADLTEHGVELLDCTTDRPAPGLGGDSGHTANAAPAALSVSSCTITASTGERSVVSTNARLAATDAPLHDLADRVRQGGAPAPDVVLIDGHYPPLARAALDLAELTSALTLMDAGSWKPDVADLPGRCQVVAPSARFHPPAPPSRPGTPAALTEPADVAAWLRGQGAGAVALTSGGAPVQWWCGVERGAVTPPAVEVVDTLGAGDVFHGALAHALAQGRAAQRARTTRTAPGGRGPGSVAPVSPAALAAAIEDACRVAAHSTTSFGTRAWMSCLSIE